MGSTTLREFLGQLEYHELVKKYGAPLILRTNRRPCAFRLGVSICMKSSNVDYRRERNREGAHGAAVTRTGIGVASLKPVITLLPSLAVYTAERSQVPSKHTVYADLSLHKPLGHGDVTRLNDIT